MKPTDLREIKTRARRLNDGFTKVNGRDLALAVMQDVLALSDRIEGVQAILNRWVSDQHPYLSAEVQQLVGEIQTALGLADSEMIVK